MEVRIVKNCRKPSTKYAGCMIHDGPVQLANMTRLIVEQFSLRSLSVLVFSLSSGLLMLLNEVENIRTAQIPQHISLTDSISVLERREVLHLNGPKLYKRDIRGIFYVSILYLL